MPEYIVLQCFACGIFQTKQRTKVPKFQCVMCGEQQTVQKLFGSSVKPREMRELVQTLNMKRATDSTFVPGTLHQIDHYQAEYQARDNPKNDNDIDYSDPDYDNMDYNTMGSARDRHSTSKNSKWDSFVQPLPSDNTTNTLNNEDNDKNTNNDGLLFQNIKSSNDASSGIYGDKIYVRSTADARKEAHVQSELAQQTRIIGAPVPQQRRRTYKVIAPDSHNSIHKKPRYSEQQYDNDIARNNNRKYSKNRSISHRSDSFTGISSYAQSMLNKTPQIPPQALPDRELSQIYQTNKVSPHEYTSKPASINPIANPPFYPSVSALDSTQLADTKIKQPTIYNINQENTSSAPNSTTFPSKKPTSLFDRFKPQSTRNNTHNDNDDSNNNININQQNTHNTFPSNSHTDTSPSPTVQPCHGAVQRNNSSNPPASATSATLGSFRSIAHLKPAHKASLPSDIHIIRTSYENHDDTNTNAPIVSGRHQTSIPLSIPNKTTPAGPSSSSSAPKKQSKWDQFD